ncbi:MAG TPA: hypothetical protein VI007_04425 [bacterium]
MRFGVFGTGVAGKAIAAKLRDLGQALVNAVDGRAALDALTLGGAANVDGKILIDIANPLDFLPRWLRLWGAVQGPLFNVKLVR